MAIVSSGIEVVRAFAIPCCIWADGRTTGLPRTALVKWKSNHSDKFYQVYVNSRFAGSTLDTEQREMVVSLPESSQTAVKIEVFAVEAKRADVDLSSEVDLSGGQSGRVKIGLLRDQRMPVGVRFSVYFDNATGRIDYDKALTSEPVSLWPCTRDKAGFGMSRFGAGDFGWDSAAAVGFEKGSFGLGQFGLDADTCEWISPQLPPGVYKFAVKVTDRNGKESIATETGQITVIPPAKPAMGMTVAAFNKQINQLVLAVS